MLVCYSWHDCLETLFYAGFTAFHPLDIAMMYIIYIMMRIYNTFAEKESKIWEKKNCDEIVVCGKVGMLVSWYVGMHVSR